MSKNVLSPATLRDRLALASVGRRVDVVVPMTVMTMVALAAPAAAQTAPTELPALTVEAEKDAKPKARPKKAV